jgi:hypothetical protein
VTSFETGVLKVRLSTREKLRIKFLTRNVLRAKAVIVTSVTLSSKVLLWIPASIAGRCYRLRKEITTNVASQNGAELVRIDGRQVHLCSAHGRQ